MSARDLLAAWRGNPFYVLEVGTDVSRADAERAGQKLLALLAVGRANVEQYQTPFGPATRDADQVRQALAALRDPNARVLHELWANIAQNGGNVRSETPLEGWEAADHAIGWTKPWPD
jgi:hypothetical protein